MTHYISKNPAIWLADTIFAHNLAPRIFARYGIGVEISLTILVFILNSFQEKRMTEFFKNSKNPYMELFWALFAQIWAKINFLGSNKRKSQLRDIALENESKIQYS